jgi:hypothetical protein
MNELIPQDSAPHEDSGLHSRWPWFLVGGCLLVILIALFSSRRPDNSGERATSTNAPGGATATHSFAVERDRRSARGSSPAPAPTAEEIVGHKINQFARNRLEIIQAIARKSKVGVPDEVGRFFEAMEAGRWDEIEGLAKALRENLRSAGLIQLWPPVHEAWGAVQEARNWPAQKLLDYGDAVLGSLRPGMVYVGGTDPGRWIPTMLNETSEGEHHMVLTQNALADGTYLDYVNFLYGDRLNSLNGDDSKRAFEDYLTDARKRLQHDQEFPDEAKQVRPGEDIRTVDGKVQVSGQVAVMSINEKLLQALMAKNPDLSFGLQESFPLKSTYADAVPLGPIMELRAPDAQSAFTAERAAQSLDSLRATAQQLLSDPEAAGSPDTLRTYSHDAVARANLLASHHYNAEAEQAYRLASQLWPENPESAGSLAAMLAHTGRADEARQLLDDFQRKHPDQLPDLEQVRASWSIVTSPPPPRP